MNEHAYLDLDEVETLEPRKCDPGCRCGRCGSNKLLELLWRNHEERRPGVERYPDMLRIKGSIAPTVVDPFYVPPEPGVEAAPEPELSPPLLPSPPPAPLVSSKSPSAKPYRPAPRTMSVDASVEEDPPSQPWQPTIESIRRAVMQHFGITLVALLSERRTFRVVRPRHIAMYLAHEMTTHSYPRIGHYFGDRDHTTVLHACRAMKSLIAHDPKLAADVEAVRALVIKADPMLGGSE